MKGKAGESSSGNELQFELKYCERCGGLWLRPVGGGQVYCVVCAGAMGELPRGPHKMESARLPRRMRWGAAVNFEGYEEYEGQDLDGAGGVA
jgi:Zn-finger nucleic acid-binding protein